LPTETDPWRTDDERGPHAGKGPKGYRRSDARLEDECCQRLTDDDRLDASSIECRVSDGEVTLTGSVADRWQKRLAEACCAAVSGVQDVHNRLRVQATLPPDYSDTGAGARSGG